MGTCEMYEMSINRNLLPPFTNEFKESLIRLYLAKDKPLHLKEAEYRRFINDYGTHFLLKTKPTSL